MQASSYSLGASWQQALASPLAVPWKTLQKVIQPLPSQVVIVLAAPGVGKSTLAIQWAGLSNARTLYVSADQDPMTTSLQLACLATGHQRELITQRLADETWRQAYSQAVQDRFPNLVLTFSSSPTIESVAHRAEALTEVWGVTPELVVIDTGSNVQKGGSDYAHWQKLWLDCGQLADTFKSVALVAHHLHSGPVSSGQVRPGLNDGQYRPEQFAEIVLALHRASGTQVEVTVLKNRGGRSQVSIPLYANYAYSRLDEI